MARYVGALITPSLVAQLGLTDPGPERILVAGFKAGAICSLAAIPRNSTKCTCQVFKINDARSVPTCPHLELVRNMGGVAVAPFCILDDTNRADGDGKGVFYATSAPAGTEGVLLGSTVNSIPSVLRAFANEATDLDRFVWLGQNSGLDATTSVGALFLETWCTFVAGIFKDAVVVQGVIAKLPVTSTDQVMRNGLDKLGTLLGASSEADAFATPLMVSLKLNGPDFYVAPELERQLTFALGTNKSVLLTGPAGCGKTEVLMRAASACGRPLQVFNMGGMTEARSGLVGCMTLGKEGTMFMGSRFLSAIATPNCVVLLDELSRANADAGNILLPLLDGQKVLTVDEDGGREVHVADGVVFTATANIGMEYTGASGALDRALMDRFSALSLNYPPAEVESRILFRRTKCDIATCVKLVQGATNQRRMAANDDMPFCISTRQLLAAATQIKFGIPIPEAIDYCIVQAFSKDGADQSDYARVMQVFKIQFPAVR